MPGYLRALNRGDLIGNKYAVVQPIGSGGMGIVYEATHAQLGQRVAVKMLLPELSHNADAVIRFEREARAAAHLRSPHAAKVFDVGALSDGTPYIVMELLEGRDLADELADRGPLLIADAVEYMLQACHAMAEAHRLGIVHRDLKPGNMFLAYDGRRSIIKVLDFGISKMLDEVAPGVTTTRSGLGTANYMSPEQVRSAKSVDARCDVWALGVVLYEMLTGTLPFPGDSATAVAAAIVTDHPLPVRSFRQDVPPALERALMTALEKDRDRRFVDAAAFSAALEPFASSRPKELKASPSGRSPESIVQDADPTLHSATGFRVPIPSRISSNARSREPRLESDRPARWSHPRNLWIPGGLFIGLFASAAFVRELARDSSTPSASAKSNTSAQAAGMASIAPAPPPSAPEGQPARSAESETPAPRVAVHRDEEVAPPASSAQTPAVVPSSSKAGPRAPASTPLSHPAVVKETTGPHPTRAGSAQKVSHGLPPDPG